MNESNMKNIVVVKDVQSNIVEEAIIILKPHIKVKQSEYIEKNTVKTKELNPKSYILNEAQTIVANYVSKIENRKINGNVKIEKKYKRLKMINTTLAILLLISSILNII